MIELEFYKENGQVNAYISQRNSSGITVSATNVKDLIEKLNGYLIVIAEEELK